MRTTLTLDDDVAALIERLRKSRGSSLKELINEGLREGLRQMTAPPRPRASYQTESVHLGSCLLPNIDNVAEILAIVEGESLQ